jgi:pyruvate/2-oxoglutarate dehydrogenase complex dihydrolipoamide dehydrogenase (E3) component
MGESSVKRYDVVVLGSGEGGKYVAKTGDIRT